MPDTWSDSLPHSPLLILTVLYGWSYYCLHFIHEITEFPVRSWLKVTKRDSIQLFNTGFLLHLSRIIGLILKVWLSNLTLLPCVILRISFTIFEAHSYLWNVDGQTWSKPPSSSQMLTVTLECQSSAKFCLLSLNQLLLLKSVQNLDNTHEYNPPTFGLLSAFSSSLIAFLHLSREFENVIFSLC